ncbi:unnamed protein product [Moneuplotes crassus]|uniref:RING-type domain-containing protein n=1 Tax=Euplotes crassus TaxID=5936 RepID=A0AAD1XQG8_EUPCR|nr:unnamed protein product [Moneuplotes crassus]
MDYCTTNNKSNFKRNGNSPNTMDESKEMLFKNTLGKSKRNMIDHFRSFDGPSSKPINTNLKINKNFKHSHTTNLDQNLIQKSICPPKSYVPKQKKTFLSNFVQKGPSKQHFSNKNSRKINDFTKEIQKLDRNSEGFDKNYNFYKTSSKRVKHADCFYSKEYLFAQEIIQSGTEMPQLIKSSLTLHKMGFEDETPEKAMLYKSLKSVEEILNYLTPDDHMFEKISKHKIAVKCVNCSKRQRSKTKKSTRLRPDIDDDTVISNHILSNNHEEIRIIKNNTKMTHILNRKELSDTFSSHPQSYFISNKRLIKNKERGPSRNRVRPEAVFSDDRSKLNKSDVQTFNHSKAKLFPYNNSRNFGALNENNQIFSQDDINQKSIQMKVGEDSSFKSIRHLNQSQEMNYQVNPINLEINRRILMDNKSESTYLNVERISQNIDGEELCAICNQSFEIHGPDYNLELLMMHNKYQDMMENISNDPRSINLLGPQSATSKHSTHSILGLHKLKTLNHDRSRAGETNLLKRTLKSNHNSNQMATLHVPSIINSYNQSFKLPPINREQMLSKMNVIRKRDKEMCSKWIHFFTELNEINTETYYSSERAEQCCMICKWSPKDLYPIECGHSVCRECISSWISERISQGDVLDLKCPDPDCECYLLDNTIQDLVCSGEYEKYKYFSKNISTILQDQIPASPGSSQSLEIDEPLARPRGVRGIYETTPDISELEEKYKTLCSKLTIQICPKCHTLVAKSKICNHLTCQNCTECFCIYCRKKFTKNHLNPLNNKACQSLIASKISQGTLGNEHSKYPIMGKCTILTLFILLLILSPLIAATILPYTIWLNCSRNRSWLTKLPMFIGILLTSLILLPISILFTILFCIHLLCHIKRRGS